MPDNVTITVEMQERDAEAFAQFLKRAGYSDFRQCARGAEETSNMLGAAWKLREAFAAAGFAPR